MSIWSSEIKELEKLYESLKSQFPELEKELGHLVKAEDENVIHPLFKKMPGSNNY